MNFTDTPFDPLKDNIVGTLWNKDDANLEDGLYKITINGSCVMNFTGNSLPVLYQNSAPPGQYAGRLRRNLANYKNDRTVYRSRNISKFRP